MTEAKVFEYEPTKYVMKGLPEQLLEEDLNNILLYAIENNASDIWFKSNDYIRADIYGYKYKLSSRTLSSAEVDRFIVKIYGADTALANLGRGDPLNTTYVLKYYPKPDPSKPDAHLEQKKLRFRINVMSVSSADTRGYCITARSIPTTPPKLDKKDVPQEVIDCFRIPTGINLVIGATGSGKSTLLAGIILDMIQDRTMSKHIVSYESPIEFSFDDVKQISTFINQTEVPRMISSFDKGLEEALRRKPDHIFVGEMRDKPTITNAILAAQTGHLVYSTLHVNAVADTIKRIAGSYDSSEKSSVITDVIASANLMLAQRLRPTLDGKRCAIREYLIFNDEIRNTLQDQELDKISFVLEQMVWDYGIPFAVHARQRFLEGKISESTLREFTRSLSKNRSMDFIDERIKQLKQTGNVMFQDNDF